MPRALAIGPRAKRRRAINPAATSRATPASMTSVHPGATPTTVRARDCSIPHRTMTSTTTWTSIPTASAATGTATTPDPFPPGQLQNGRWMQPPFQFLVAIKSDDDDPRADIDAAVQVDHILIAHPDAARRDVGADGPGLVGAVDAIQRGSQIHRARAERILRTAFHVPRQIGAARQHFRRRRPSRPFLLGGTLLDARPAESGAADPDAVAHRLAVFLHQVQKLVGRIDDDGAGAFLAVIFNELLFEFRIEGALRGIACIFLLAQHLLRLHRRHRARFV